MDHKNEVKKYLQGIDKEELVSLLLENAENDELLRSRLLLKASRGGKKVHRATFKKAIDRAVGFDTFDDYRSMDQYAAGIESVVDSLNDLCCENHAADLIELSEYLLERLETQMDSVDDSDGEMGEILNCVQELHHDACVLAKPDPEQLAQKLFSWEMNGEWEVFYGAVTHYADVLGDKGLKVYAELAEKKWVSFPTLKAGDDKQSDTGNRFRITSIMHQLAEQTGDIEKVVAVKMKDLSFAYSYLQIAELYKKKRKLKKALEWAEKGVEAFPVNTDSRLREFLSNEYHRLERHDDAMRVAWDNFSDRATFDAYKILKIHAAQAGGATEWARWREQALQYIRDGIAQSKQQSQQRQWAWNLIDHSELVRIFLWEKNIDAAWAEAQTGRCHRSLWLELASKREAAHPEDSIAVYRSVVTSLVDEKKNNSYSEAADLVKKLRRLFTDLDKTEEWEKYLTTLRTEHKPKRNFMALLNGLH